MTATGTEPPPAWPESGSKPGRRTKWSVGGRVWGLVAQAFLALVVAVITWPHDGFGIWFFGPYWYWICLGLWSLALVVTAVLTWFAWRRPTAVVIVVILMACAAAWSQASNSQRLTLVGNKQAWFSAHRADFDEAARFETGSCCEDNYLGDLLPDHLRYLTVNGKVTGQPGALFFAQWFAIPDDAGGFWYTGGSSPEGWDMFGMICQNPVDLHGGWWMCGMK